MLLQSERLLNHMVRLRLTHLPNCFEAIAEEASAKDLPYLDFLEQTLEAESQAKHVLLLGTPGVGKTHLDIALGTEAIVAGSSFYFVSVQDLVTVSTCP